MRRGGGLLEGPTSQGHLKRLGRKKGDEARTPKVRRTMRMTMGGAPATSCVMVGIEVGPIKDGRSFDRMEQTNN